MIDGKKKEIIKILQKMGGKYSPDQIFADWVECMALALENSCSLFHDKVWQNREEAYKRIMQKYDPEEQKNMVKMFVLLSQAMENELSDLLGEIYMESGCGSKQTGQFFTPYHLSLAMARLTVPENITDETIFSMNEPSCGGGGMIIATAAELKERGLNYQRCMKVVAQDLDWRSVYMTYVQLSLLGIDAIVVQGNTLAEPYIVSSYPQERIFRTPKNRGILL